MWDVTTQTALSAIEGLSQRGNARAHNIANAEVPGFRAQHVDFETALSDAVRRGTPAQAQFEVTASPSMLGPNGNSVDLETEMVNSMKDGLSRQAMGAGFNFKLGQMRVAMGGQR